MPSDILCCVSVTSVSVVEKNGREREKHRRREKEERNECCHQIKLFEG